MSHPRAKLTVQGRRLLVERVLELGWTVPMAAEAQGCSPATGYKWIRRFAAEGYRGLHDRSSRPHRSPARLSARREAAIVARRHATLEGPHRIGWALGEAPSTVNRVLRRLGVPRLRDLDRPTRMVVRYERERPGELIHVDIKKQGRIPLGGGWRVHGRADVPGSKRHRGDGYDFVHAAVDDRSRLAYAEILPDERKETASAFMTRALGFFADRGVQVERVLTDNGLATAPRVHPGPRRCRHQTSVDPSLPSPDQWQGRAVQPHAQVGVGLREALRDERLTHRRARALAPPLQLPSTSHGSRGRAPITVLNNVPRKHN